ncbi:MAG: GDSL-type esterase/lipase family protein [Alistipes sp.]|nr:GDSL-type esterase/lipase family protein [Alistipes sp.]
MAGKRNNILILAAGILTGVLFLGGIIPALFAASGRQAADPEIIAPVPEPLPRVVFKDDLGGLVNDELNVFVDLSGNLAPFMARLEALRSGEYTGDLNILHIGDSHVQAGFWDERVRMHLVRDFGSGGRGVILPHRLTGTNEPRDYYIRTGNAYEGFRLTSNSSKEKLSFTGTGILFDYNYPEVELWTREGFDAVTIIHHPKAPLLSPPDSLMGDMQCVMGDTEERTTFYLNRKVDTLTLSVRYDLPGTVPDNPHPLYYGFILHKGHGIVYNSIGANSAAFEHFERYSTIPAGGGNQLFPDLIIISLGTNNCYGRNYRSDNLATVVDRFLGAVSENYPGIPVLVTTPRESGQRSGRNYVANPNIEDAAKVISRSAEKYNFAFWDLYNAAGGRGIMEKWYEKKLSGRDRIHLTENGYNLVGDMMYDALAKYYNEFIGSVHRPATGRAAHGFPQPNINPDEDVPFIRFAALEILAGNRSY